MDYYNFWTNENLKKRFTFYLLYVTDDHDDDDNIGTEDSRILANLTAYTTNEWVLSQYIKFYRNLLSKVEYKVFTYEYCTHDEFGVKIKRDLNLDIEGIFIESDEVQLTHTTFYMNENLLESGYSMTSDFDEVFNTYLPAFVMAKQLIQFKYFKESESLEIIRDFLYRICSAYVPMVYLSTYADDLGVGFPGLEDGAKIGLTKVFNFPRPLEDIEYYEIISSGYEYLTYLKNYTIVLDD